MKRHWMGLAIFTAALAVLILHASRYLPFVADDALISLRYSQRLLEGHGLSWTDGERVEGYSNLLWVLAAAGLGALGVELILALRILGLLGMGAAIAAVVWAYRPRGEGLGGMVPPLGAALGVALAGPIAVWAIGGLEQAFVAGLLAWALVLAYPLVEEGGERVRGAGVPLALLVLTRPDGPIFTAAIALAIVLCRGVRGLRTATALVALPLAAFLCQLGFRLIYYGDWVANTARAKVSFSPEHLRLGLSYLGSGGLWLGGLVLLALGVIFTLGDGRNRRRALLLVLPLAAWLAWVATVGGDIFPGRRHLVPAVVVLALLAAEFLRWATTHRESWIRLGGASFGALGLLVFGVSQWHDPDNHRAIHERWEWDGLAVGQLLRAAFGEKAPLLAVDPAGCLPFFSGLPAVDMLGLNDGWLARNPPPDFGKGSLGHELGNGAYVLSRNPDLVLFCLPGGGSRPCFLSGRELVKEPRFRREWSLITFEAREPHRFSSQVWVRKEGGGKIGIERREGRTLVPGYFLATTGEVQATLGPDDRIGAFIREGKRGRVALPVAEGGLLLEAKTTAPIRVDIHQGGQAIASGAPPLRAIVKGGEIAIAVTAAGSEPAHVQELLLLPQAIQASTRTAP